MTSIDDWGWVFLIRQNVRFSTPIDGPILWCEKKCRLYENPNAIPRVRDTWLHINITFLGGLAKFFKPKHRDRLQEGNWIIRVKFFECEAYVLSYKL